MGGDHPFTPQIIIPGWTAGRVRALWVKQGHLSAHAYLNSTYSSSSIFYKQQQKQ